LAEEQARPVETERQINGPGRGTAFRPARSGHETIRRKEVQVNAVTHEKDQVPPATHSAPPEKELERKLQKNPDCPDAKVDVGSDESMDASDPPSASQPGNADEPVPSSGFPDKD